VMLAAAAKSLLVTNARVVPPTQAGIRSVILHSVGALCHCLQVVPCLRLVSMDKRPDLGIFSIVVVGNNQQPASADRNLYVLRISTVRRSGR
jgi:hypothetical protein